MNVINYAYPEGTEGEIELNVTNAPVADSSDSAKAVRFTLIDKGKPFDPTTQGEADITSGLDERPIGGLGIHLTRSIMDRMEYRREGDSNVLIMIKIIN